MVGLVELYTESMAVQRVTEIRHGNCMCVRGSVPTTPPHLNITAHFRLFIVAFLIKAFLICFSYNRIHISIKWYSGQQFSYLGLTRLTLVVKK